MNDMFDTMFEDSTSSLDNISLETSKSLSNLVRKMRGIEDEIEDAETHIKALKAEKHKLSTDLIPALMDEMGVERLDVDGASVTCKPIVHAHISEEKRGAAFNWLREKGFDDIIKNDITLTFGKGEDNLAGDVIGMLEDRGFHPNTKTHIHPQTLKAFLREQLSQGTNMDLDMFGAYVLSTAEIKRK
jgi:hypothetical protein|tara:strand:+ start:1122 stop:1682 length:561 start_codon:yes stop_codon:yes gene_type:complete